MCAGILLLQQAEISSTALAESRTADDVFCSHTEKAIVMVCWHNARWLNLLAANQSSLVRLTDILRGSWVNLGG